MIEIGIEHLAANAMIESKSRCVALSSLWKYGVAVANYLKDQEVHALVLLSGYCAEASLREHCDYFEVVTVGGKGYVCLKKDKTVEDLRMRFRAYLSLAAYLALTRKEAMKMLYSEDNFV